MPTYAELCSSFSVPLWVAPLLQAASRHKSDAVRRKKVYRLLQRKLRNHRVGCSSVDKPTYIYPAPLKQLIRTAFPEQICNYDDPHHQNVVAVSMEDLNVLNLAEKRSSEINHAEA